MLPFSPEQFFDVFRAYNLAVWPWQWVLTAAGLFALAGAAVRTPAGARLALGALSALWLWMAVAYHLLQFARINPAARAFAGLFALQAGLLLWEALRPSPPAMGLVASPRGFAGLLLAVFGLAVYPLLNPAFGHAYPAAPGFGLPCPTTIFTLGILSWLRPAPDRRLLAIPVLWSAIGATAAVLLGVPQDFVLAGAGAWGVYLLAARRHTA